MEILKLQNCEELRFTNYYTESIHEFFQRSNGTPLNMRLIVACARSSIPPRPEVGCANSLSLY